MSENRPGRPREYASDADRVRAWRARQKEKVAPAAAEFVETPVGPAEAAVTLSQVLPLLRQEAEGAVARLSAVADRIIGSVDLLGDPAAVDAHLRRAQVTADKVRADAAAEIEQLRDQLDTAVDDRANADAAARAAEQAAEESAGALADARRDHGDQLHALAVVHEEEMTALTAEHRAKNAEQHSLIESLRTRTTELGEEITQVRGAADRAAAASAATIGRLESDLDEARIAIQSERTRADEVRDELATTRADLATAQAQAAAARERVEELRADLTEARSRVAAVGERRTE
ncbi:hypothetical protein [Rhodococcus sp. T7]|uniref:hypothetical protein n=1 Tax=Rhodococcus sp. T7 TaxID=627444 RepID=UPI00135CB9B6|nr:hypothetical protein [Rhodococcus sp. T7]KAF0957317.1 hypothetical protein MLGJGCBP_09147 [Rhodococcus sp. T7]KAF0959190.1 hypothetical protein MLGJGCBP_07703 [Rhodococcus sp. T7]